MSCRDMKSTVFAFFPNRDTIGHLLTTEQVTVSIRRKVDQCRHRQENNRATLHSKARSVDRVRVHDHISKPAACGLFHAYAAKAMRLREPSTKVVCSTTMLIAYRV